MTIPLTVADGIEDSIDFHLARHGRAGHFIYLALVALTLAALASLPLLHVDVAVQSAGIVRPLTEKHEVRPQLAGVVESVFVRENDVIERNAPLLSLRSATLDERASLVDEQLAQKQREVADLELLATSTADARIDTRRFTTGEARQEYAQLAEDLRGARSKRDKAARERDRTRQMRDLGFASAQELEERDYQLTEARGEMSTIVERALGRWQTALATRRQELKELASRKAQVDEERSLYVVRAPVAGAVEQLAAVSPGSGVQIGDRIAVLSPSAALIADVYVAPSDIGMLRVGAPVRMMIDAYNANDWGVVTGRIAAISSDFVDIEGRPMFKVQCAMQRTTLSLRNGATGTLRKGMTLRARFLVARRSLFQLLRDGVSDFVDPARTPAAASDRP